MSTSENQLRSTTITAAQYLLFFVLLSITLLYGRELLVPLVSAAFFAMLMAPVSGWMEKKLNRTFSTILCILMLIVVVLGVFAIIVGEISSFTDDLPAIQKKANLLLKNLETFIQANFDIAPEKQIEMAKHQVASIGSSAGSYFTKLVSGVTGALAGLFITMVYTFLLLIHRERYETFFIKLFGKKDPDKTREIIDNVASVGQHYISGRTISVLILWVIYVIGFLIAGIKSAILLAAIAALISIIPYIGGFIGGLFPFFMALATEESSGPAVAVAAIIIISHALSTYIIEPLVVGGRMKLSALSMIIVIIAGNALWGVLGMILFVPMLAMIKIVCDNVDYLKPFGYVVADPEEGKPSPISDWFGELWAKIFPKSKHPKRRTSKVSTPR